MPSSLRSSIPHFLRDFRLRPAYFSRAFMAIIKPFAALRPKPELANRICDALDLIDHERGLLDREYACARRIASAVGTEAALEKNSDVRAAVSRAIGENVDGCRNIASRTVSMMSGASRAIGFDESHHTASRARDARD